MQGSPLRIFPLLIVVAFLSMGIRVGEIFTGVSEMPGAAFAEDTEKPAEKMESDEDKAAENQEEQAMEEAADMPAMDVSDKAKDEIIWRDASDSDIDLSSVKMEVYEDLAERRKQLQQQEKSLATREALLRAAEQELERKYQELDNIRTEIMTLLNQQSEEEKQRITSLVKIYEGMKAKEAARIFDTLDLDILVAVAGQMSERKLSAVLAAMDPERARTLTIMMAEQKTLPTLPMNN